MHRKGQPQGQAGIQQALQQAAQQQAHGEQAETPGHGPQEAAVAPLQGHHGHARGQGQEQFGRRARQDQQQDQHQPIGRQGEPALPPLRQGQHRQAELGHRQGGPGQGRQRRQAGPGQGLGRRTGDGPHRFPLGGIEGRTADLALLALLEPVHQHGVVGRLDLGPGLGIVAEFVQAGSLSRLHLIKTGVRADAKTLVGRRPLAGCG